MEKPPQAEVPVAGLWDGEALELGKRFAYRSEFLPLLLGYLGAAPGMRILDVGSGTGFLARLLVQNLQGATVVGVDSDSSMLELAQQKIELDGLKDRVSMLSGNAYELSFGDEEFDLVTSHTLLCILTDPERALREQIRVTRRGGVISAVTCFCRTDGLPHYHGRTPLGGDRRIDHLSYALWQVWRKEIRPRLLEIDAGVLNQDVLWLFRNAGLENVQVNGHLALMSPGDDRIPAEMGAAYALARVEKELDGLVWQHKEYGEELAALGFSIDEFNELLELKRERLEYLKRDPMRVQEVMEVFTEPYLIVRGTRPPIRS